MSDATRSLTWPRAALPGVRVAVAGLLAVAIAVAIGNPTPGGFLLVAAAVALTMVALVLRRPVIGFVVLVASAFILAVVAVTENNYASFFDLLLPPMLGAWLLSRDAREARAAEARFTTGPHGQIAGASRAFERSVCWFFGLAALSIAPMAVRIGVKEAFDSTLHLIRTVQGVMVYPVILWCVRSPRRLRQAYHAALAGGAIFAVVNLAQVLFMGVPRAGITWVTNHPDWPVEGANEAGATMVVLVALILADHAVRPRLRNYFMLGGVIFLLFLTLSRSGILAMLVFFAFGLRRLRWRHIVTGVALIGVTLAMVPWEFWWRMSRSLAFTRGSFEVYTFMIRVYGYWTAMREFAHNWLFGVGWLGGHFISQNYNELKIANLGAENFFLETAVGMGIVGLAVLAVCLVRLYRLGGAVRRATRRGTPGHELARVHTPLMTGLLVANLTGDNFVGMVSLAQMAVWVALLVRAGHLAVDETAPV